MRSSLVCVLDLGSTKVVCMAAEPDEKGNLRVIAVSSVDCKGVRRGAVTDLDATAAAIEEAVRKVEGALEEPINSLIVAVGGPEVQGVNGQGFVPIYPRSRTISRDDVLQVINHSRQMMLPPDREQIQALPREFRVDGQRGVAKPVGMSGSKLEVVTYLVTAPSTQIDNLEKAMNMAGKKVEMVVLQPLASGLGVLTPQELDLGSVVIDIGGATTEVAVFANGSIAYSASLPLGAQHVTSDLSKLLKTSVEEAERLKLEFGSAIAAAVTAEESVEVLQLGQTHRRPLQRKVLCEIIESRMRELALLVKQQIEKSGLFAVLPGGVVLTGGGSLLPESAKLFESVLQHLRVRQGSPKLGGPLKGTVDRAEMATAAGLARYALECAEDELATVDGQVDWKDKIRTIWSMVKNPAGRESDRVARRGS